jgi:hypothetical protein
MKQFGGYDQLKPSGDFIQLPKGGYVCKIMGIETKQNSRGAYFIVSFDIAEGEFKDYYANDYRNQSGEDKKWHGQFFLSIPNDDGTKEDGWSKQAFRNWTGALEDSNPNYHWDWDENKWKGKLIGGLFNNQQYISNTGEVRDSTKFARPTSVEKIRSGDYKLPKDKLKEAPAAASPAGIEGFVNVPSGSDDELPFD